MNYRVNGRRAVEWIVCYTKSVWAEVSPTYRQHHPTYRLALAVAIMKARTADTVWVEATNRAGETRKFQLGLVPVKEDSP